MACYKLSTQASGAYLVLITCREGAELTWAVDAAKKVGVVFDAANENLPFIIPRVGDPRKIFCNVYIDDHNLSLREIEAMTQE